MAESDNSDPLPTEQWDGASDAEIAPLPPQRLSDSALEGMLGARPPLNRGGWQPPAPEELQARLPQYEIKALLGRGGMGAVYQGWQRSLDRFVAIKILPPGLQGEDADFATRFKREAKAMARLKHPGIIPVHDAGETADGLLYFVMDYVEGTDVQKLLAAQGRLPEEQALGITTHVLDALAYAHQHGIIHRDIKPANILVDEEGHVHVADFGLARNAAGDSTMLTGSHVSMGTPDFMAPESRLGAAQVDHRADLYAVGVMLYQMLTGKLPHGRFETPSRAVPGLDKRLDRIVDRALQPDRDARYSSATELRTDLAPVLSRAMAKRSDGASPVAKSRAVYFGVAVFVFVAAGGAWFFTQQKARHETRAPSSNTASPNSTLEPGAIRLWDAPDRLPQANGVRWENNALRADKASPWTVGMVSRDAIMRASIRANPDAQTLCLALRLRFLAEGGGREMYQVSLDVRAKTLTLWSVHNSKGGLPLKVWPLPRSYGPEEWVRLELRAIGDAVTVSVDGRPLGTVHDNSQMEAGFGMLGADINGYFRDIVYVPMDKAADGTATTAPLEPGAIKLWDAPEKIPPGAQWENSALTIGEPVATHTAFYFSPESRDAIIRTDIRMNPDAKYPQIALRYNSPPVGDYYSLSVDAGKAVYLASNHHLVPSKLRAWPLPRVYGPEEWIRVELKVVGEELSVSVDGKLLGTVHDHSVSAAGGVMIYATEHGYFRNIVYVPLDNAGKGAAAASDAMGLTAGQMVAEYPVGRWAKVVFSANALAAQEQGATINEAGEVTCQWSVTVPDVRARNVAVRGEMRRPTSKLGLSAALRYTKENWRQLAINSNFQLLQLRLPGDQYTNLSVHSTTMDLNDWVPFQVACVGQKSLGSVGGVLFTPGVSEQGVEPGEIRIGPHGGSFRNLELLLLDGLPEEEALKLATPPAAEKAP